LEFLKFQSLLEKHKITKQAKIEFLTGEIEKAKTAFKEKNYSQLQIRELIKLLEKLEVDLKNETESVKYCTGEYTCKDTFELPLTIQEEEITIGLY
jgi:hypothetical protein